MTYEEHLDEVTTLITEKYDVADQAAQLRIRQERVVGNHEVVLPVGGIRRPVGPGCVQLLSPPAIRLRPWR